MILSDIFEVCGYKFSHGDKFLWKSFGENAQIVEFTKNKMVYNSGVSCYFDTSTQEIFMVEIFTKHDKWYRWINPLYLEVYKKEHEMRNIDFFIANVDTLSQWIELDETVDVIRKCQQVIETQDCDNEVTISLKLDDDTISLLSEAATVKGISLEEFVSNVMSDMFKDIIDGKFPIQPLD